MPEQTNSDRRQEPSLEDVATFNKEVSKDMDIFRDTFIRYMGE